MSSVDLMLEVPALHVLRSQLRDRALGLSTGNVPFDAAMVSTTRERVLNLELEQLPYNLTAAWQTLRELEGLLRQLPAVALVGFPFPLTAGATVGLLAQQTFPIAWAVDRFLDTSRRAQNALTRYVARTFGASLPASLNDLVSGSQKYQQRVPARVLALLTEYIGSTKADVTRI